MSKLLGLITPGQIKFLKLGTWGSSSMPQKSSRAHWLFQSLLVHRPYILGSIRELNTNCKMYKDKMFSGSANHNPFTHLSSTGCLNPLNGQSQSLPTWILWETYFLPVEVLKTVYFSLLSLSLSLYPQVLNRSKDCDIYPKSHLIRTIHFCRDRHLLPELKK